MYSHISCPDSELSDSEFGSNIKTCFGIIGKSYGFGSNPSTKILFLASDVF